MNLIEKIEAAAAYIRAQSPVPPQTGLILGSGLGVLADEIESPVKLDYKDIPHFPLATVEGHAGKLVLGTLEGKQVVALQGRFHYYEGYSMEQITFPVRVMKALGAAFLLVTNACGGINPEMGPGDFMIISDHINFTGDNPLIGPHLPELGARFPDMSNAYDPELRAHAKTTAEKLGIDVKEGIYTAISGPYYLSPAELRMIRGFGSDTIGMSTVPEVIVARQGGIRVLGISCITDRAVPEDLEPLDHAHVVEVARQARPRFITLMRGIIAGL